ncbi:STAS domain-containing protein [Streptomyces paromomycinus]|uniref:Anti-sigma-B factor antagonist n=1 Tax=Streptomyces paromomycinus TaxID=92743 RepID=A0A401VXH7_STREY|nr:STAS domain-containing protein [Streptomyces paromomycinus]GCD41778.1 anti-sigma-B factor antagonist [Streptomyces paromomycinus]
MERTAPREFLDADGNPAIAVDGVRMSYACRPECTVVTFTGIRGGLDLYNAPVFRDRLRDLVAGGCGDMVIVLADIGYVDETALGAFVFVRKRLRRTGHGVRIVEADPGSHLRKLVRQTGMTSIFPLFDRLEDALAELAGNGAGTGEAASARAGRTAPTEHRAHSGGPPGT